MARASGTYVVAGIVLAAVLGGILALRYRTLVPRQVPVTPAPATAATAAPG